MTSDAQSPPILTTWQHRSVEAFSRTSGEFLQYLSGIFKDDDDLLDMMLFHTNIVTPDQGKKVEAVQAWFENLQEGLNTSVKYRKALDRILADKEEPFDKGCVLHAVQFSDLDAVIASSTSPTWCRLKMGDRVKSAVWEKEHTSCTMHFLTEMTRDAFYALDIAMPRCPTRDDIARDIQQHRSKQRSTTNNGAIARGVHDCIERLHALNTASSSERPPPLDVGEISAIGKIFGDMKDDMCSAIRAKDAHVLPKIGKLLPQLEMTTEGDRCSNEQWELLIQAVNLTSVTKTVPTTMMQEIENYAETMASDIMSGRMNLGSMDLEKMGNEVLANMQQKDIDALSGNVDGLMPAIEQLQKGLMNNMTGAMFKGTDNRAASSSSS